MMKTTIYLMLTLTVLWLPKPLFAAQPDVNSLLQKGLFEEEANQNLEAAIKNYQALIQQAEEQRKLVATAVFRLGECYRKQGRTNEAAGQYRRIVSDYADQNTLVNLSRQNLVGLGMPLRVEAAEYGKNDQYRNLTPAQRQEMKKLLQDDLGLAEKSLAEAKKRVELGLASTEELGKYQKQALDLKRQLLAVDGLATPEDRKQYKDLVQSEIQIAEKAIEGRQRMVAIGRASSEEVITAQRELLALKRELVLAESAPAQSLTTKAPAEPEVDPEAKDIERVQALLKDSPDLINTPNGGDPWLHRAATGGKLKLAEFLVSHGADINVRGNFNMTPLHVAVKFGQKAIVEFLLDHGANVNARCNQNSEGQTALHQAAENGNKAIVEILLAHKADVNPRTGQGIGNPYPFEWAQVTPLHRAVVRGQKAIAELLVQNGADVGSKDKRGFQPLHYAVINGYMSIAQLLLANKADVNGVTSDEWTPLDYAINNANLEMAEFLLKNKADVNATMQDSGTPLLLAVSKENQSMVELLLKYKANVNARNGRGFMPLHTLVYPQNNPSFSGREQMFETLVAHGADINAQVKSESDYSPLHMIVSKNDEVLLKFILKHKPNLNARAGGFWGPGATPLHIASGSPSAGRLRMAEMLLAAGAEVNSLNERKETPLFSAVASAYNNTASYGYVTPPPEYKDMVELLLKHKANVNVINSMGKTPLALAKAWQSNRPGIPTITSTLRGRSGVPDGGATAPATPSRPEVIEAVIQLLKKAGANEALENLTTIEVTRRGLRFGRAFERAYTNEWSQHTLLEVLAKAVGFAEAGIGERAAFPDFANVRITRWDLATGRPKEIPVNVAKLLEIGDRSQDVPLQWGDSVEIPELDHKTSEAWRGLSAEEGQAFSTMLEREVTIIVKGEGNRRKLVIWEGRVVPDQSGGAGQPVVGRPITSFELWTVLWRSGLLRTSSDITRVKVKRPEPKGWRETIVNAGQQNPGNEVWLQDRDIIEVPEK